MQQLVALRALRKTVSLFYATYATPATQDLALRIRCVVKEIAHNA